MKDNTKITLSYGQLKKLVSEANTGYRRSFSELGEYCNIQGNPKDYTIDYLEQIYKKDIAGDGGLSTGYPDRDLPGQRYALAILDQAKTEKTKQLIRLAYAYAYIEGTIRGGIMEFQNKDVPSVNYREALEFVGVNLLGYENYRDIEINGKVPSGFDKAIEMITTNGENEGGA